MSVAIFTAALTLVFGLYFVTQFQPSTTTSEFTTRESSVINRETKSGATDPPETEIRNDTDLENTLNELDTTDLDELDTLLKQNDVDAANF